ncbi:DUF6603 domain-containing protein [Streptomyces sp. NPDC088261]|uniref:DUF6603 domain-containing protein n=1 Tax=Streptomyces sp. NPDC088261 TaxID=3365851 RepID=UPI0037F9C31C
MTTEPPALPGIPDPGDGNAQALLVGEVRLLLAPLLGAAGNGWHRDALLDALGWDLAALPAGDKDLAVWLTDIAGAVTRLVDLAEDPPDSLDDLVRVFSATSAAFTAVRALPASLAALDAAALARDVLDHLVVGHLLRHHPVLHHCLVLLGVIVPAADAAVEPGIVVGGAVVRRPLARARVRPERLVGLVTDPLGTLREVYLPEAAFPGGLATEAAADALAGTLLPRLGALLRALGVDALIGLGEDADLAGLGFDADSVRLGRRMLSLTHRAGDPALGAELDLTLGLASEETGGLGVVVVPSGAVVIEQLLGHWGLRVDLSAAGEGLAVGPHGATLGESSPPHARLSAELRRLADGGPALRLGSADGTRLEIGEARFWLAAEAIPADAATGAEATTEVEIGLAAQRAAVVVAPGDGDGFLAQVLPADGLRAEFALGLVWSRRKGLRFEGAAALEAALPVHLTLGPLEVQGVRLALAADDEGIRAGVTGTVKVALGPVTATVERMGLALELRPAPDGDGDLGPFSLDAAFVPPTGAALKIEAGPVTGGGYLSFDTDKEQYAGVLALDLKGISLKAVGLLTTRMPDGSEGFSLLVVISAEFTPVQLGFGFTLNGVGGLIGVNRSVDLEALRTGVRTGALDSLLFPDDPLGRAPELVATLGAVFPATPGRHVVGPMARIGWGTPTLLTIDVGLLLELPAPLRLALLGRLRMALPTPEAALVVVNVDIVGTVDFERAEASLDASLRDSRIAAFTLTGDLAMRASWGDRPSFALAAGGFHPRFQPPPNFPRLKRLTLSLLSGDNPRLRLESYLALTSNTAQFGARVELYASALGFSVEGMLSFDALVQFEPFGFLAEMVGALALKCGSRTVMGVRVEVMLSGPGRWHARGRARFEILFFSAEISFDKTFGSAVPAARPEGVDVAARLEEALDDPRSWTAQLPGAGNSVVTLRQITDAEDRLLVHPLGSLAVTQRVAPLGVTLDRFGQARVSGDRTLRLTALRVRSSPAAEPVGLRTAETREYFAPAQFLDLGDDEKLDRPSFERLPAGCAAEPATRFGRDLDVLPQAEPDYDLTVVGPAAAAGFSPARTVTSRADLRVPAAAATRAQDGAALLARTAVSPAARAATRRTGKQRFTAPGRALGVRDTSFAVVGAPAGAGGTGGTADAARSAGAAPLTFTEAAQLRRDLARRAPAAPYSVQQAPASPARRTNGRAAGPAAVPDGAGGRSAPAAPPRIRATTHRPFAGARAGATSGGAG